MTEVFIALNRWQEKRKCWDYYGGLQVQNKTILKTK